MTLSNGCSIPAEVSALVGRYGESEESFRAAGHAFTVSLVQRLIEEARTESISTRSIALRTLRICL
jgi:hypothetical protein